MAGGEAQEGTYPVRLTMAYPEHLSRLTTFFRLVLAMPVVLFLYLFQGSVVVAIWATVLVRGRIPRWLFDFQVGLNRFGARASAYFWLLTDKYPAFEGPWPLEYDVAYPEHLSRWRLVFWKLTTALPHIVILAFLSIAAAFVVFIAWWIVLFTGKFPRGLHRFVVGVVRWGARVTAYVESLTDVFPPYSLDEDAGPGRAVALSAVIGAALVAVIVGGGIAIGVAVYSVSHETETVHVQLDAALAGRLPASDQRIVMDSVAFALTSGDAAFSSDVIRARPGYRLIEFTVGYENRKVLRSRNGSDIENRSLRLKTDSGSHASSLITIDGVPGPSNVLHGQTITLKAYFEIGEDDQILELQAYPDPTSSRHIAWKFEP